MTDWSAIENVREPILDLLKTIMLAVGATVAYVGLNEQYKLRRLQVLSSLNERLGKCSKAYIWIYNPHKRWGELDDETKYEYQNYIAVFEDIGLARKLKIINRGDFLASYGARYKKLCDSGTLAQFIAAANYDHIHFGNLDILNKDIGRCV